MARKGILGTKLGMTQVFDENNQSRSGDCGQGGPNVVTRIRTPELDGYSAVQLAYGEISPRKVNKPVTGQYTAAGVNPRRHVAELRLETPDAAAEYEVGQELTAEIFADGSYVDVTGTSKGKGFAGTMKRHGFRGQGATHGAQAVHRRPGSIGGCSTPGAGVQGHPDVGPHGQRPGDRPEPVGAQGRCRERRAVDQGCGSRPHRRTRHGPQCDQTR